MPLGTLGARLYRGEVSYDFVGRRKRLVRHLRRPADHVDPLGLLFRGLNLGIEFKGGAVFTGHLADGQRARRSRRP